MKPIASEADAIHEIVDAEIASWPDIVRSTDPGRSDALARYRWMRGYGPIARREMKRAAMKETPSKKHDAKRTPYSFQHATDIAW